MGTDLTLPKSEGRRQNKQGTDHYFRQMKSKNVVCPLFLSRVGFSRSIQRRSDSATFARNSITSAS